MKKIPTKITLVPCPSNLFSVECNSPFPVENHLWMIMRKARGMKGLVYNIGREVNENRNQNS